MKKVSEKSGRADVESFVASDSKPKRHARDTHFFTGDLIEDEISIPYNYGVGLDAMPPLRGKKPVIVHGETIFA